MKTHIGFQTVLRGVRITVATVLLAALGACHDGGDGSSAEPPKASATIGATGGTLTGPDGAQVVIPPQALTEDTVITIKRTDQGAPGDFPQGWTRHGHPYEFTPHDIQFALPVTIRIPATQPAGATDFDVFSSSPTVPWHPLSATIANGFAEWESSTFSFGYGGTCVRAIPVGDPIPTDPLNCELPTVNFTAVTANPAAALTQPFSTFRNSLVTAASTVTLTADYTAQRGCGNGRMKISRRLPGKTLETVVRDEAVVLTPVTGSKGSYSTSFTLSCVFQ
jgi:ZU5 domain